MSLRLGHPKVRVLLTGYSRSCIDGHLPLLTRGVAATFTFRGPTLLSRRIIWVVLSRPPLELLDTQKVHARTVEVGSHLISVALPWEDLGRRAYLD